MTESGSQNSEIAGAERSVGISVPSEILSSGRGIFVWWGEPGFALASRLLRLWWCLLPPPLLWFSGLFG